MGTTYKFWALFEADSQLVFTILNRWVVAWTDVKLFDKHGFWHGQTESTFTLSDDAPGYDFLIWILDKSDELPSVVETLELVQNYTGQKRNKEHLTKGKHPLFVEKCNADWFKQNRHYEYRTQLRRVIAKFIDKLEAVAAA